MRVLVVGGGIFGLTSAIVLAENGHEVVLIEKHDDFMQEASKVNQNRIHYGYHYPRSRATCQESLAGLNSFREFYGQSINASFKKYYAIAKENSQVSSAQFAEFCASLNLPLEEQWPDEKILNRELLDACWLTPEPIFDFNHLKESVLKRAYANPKIKLIKSATVVDLKETAESKEVKLSNGERIHCDLILNASYAGLSDVLSNLNRGRIQAKYQWCVMPILQMDNPPAPFGITIMDGPFCSLMPKGFEKNNFILYHVVHSVLAQQVGELCEPWQVNDNGAEEHILNQSLKYYPILKDMRIVGSWKTTRIVLPESEKEDARPTLVINNENGVYSIFSGKLTTCVDAARQMLSKIESL